MTQLNAIFFKKSYAILFRFFASCQVSVVILDFDFPLEGGRNVYDLIHQAFKESIKKFF